MLFEIGIFIIDFASFCCLCLICLKLDRLSGCGRVGETAPQSQSYRITEPIVYRQQSSDVITLIREDGSLVGFRHANHPDVIDTRNGKNPGIFIKEEQ